MKGTPFPFRFHRAWVLWPWFDMRLLGSGQPEIKVIYIPNITITKKAAAGMVAPLRACPGRQTRPPAKIVIFSKLLPIILATDRSRAPILKAVNETVI